MSLPKCPNHGVSMNKTDERRVWICPISGYRFEADSDENEATQKIDKYGRPIVEWKLKALDGNGG